MSGVKCKMAATPRSSRPQFSTITDAAWSFHENMCAAIGNDFRVHFLNASGADQIPLRISRNQRAATIEWSAIQNSLAIGWSDGTLSVWNDEKVLDGEALQRSPLTHIAWHPYKPLVAGASRMGDVCIWDTSDGKMERLVACKTELQITKLMFRPCDEPVLFLVAKDGAIYSFEKEAEQFAAIPTPIVHVSVSSDGERLVCVSGDNVMTQFHVKTKGKKLQTKLESGNNVLFTDLDADSLCFSVDGTIFVTKSDASEPIKLEVEGGNVVGLQFYSASSELAAMTDTGKVIVWRFDREKRTFSVSRKLESSLETKRAFWSPFSKIAVTIATDDSFSVCAVPVIRCLSARDVVVLQTDTKSLSLSGNHRKRFPFNIERLAASGSLLLVASDSGARVFSMGYGTLSKVSEFDIPSPLVEILGENVFVVNGKELEVRNVSGEIKNTLQVETNSAISHLSLNGKYLCLGGRDALSLQIFLYDVSRRVPSLVATSVFAIRNKVYRIRSIAVSRGGFCVSVALDFFTDGKWQNSPKLYLHSPLKHKTIALATESGCPLNHLWDTVSGSILCVQTATAVCPFFVDKNLETRQLKEVSMTSERVIFRVECPRILHVMDGTKGPPLSVDGAVSASFMSQFATLDGIDATTRRILIEVLFAVQSENRDYAREIVEGLSEPPILRSALRFLLSVNERDLAEICANKLTSEVPTSIGKSDDRLSFINHLSSTSYDEAATVCAPTDKLNVKANAYLLGLMAEFDGKIDKALEYFESADCKPAEMLRMAMHQGNLSQLFKAATGGIADPQLHLWLGRFYEYHQKFDMALSHYDICGDLRESIRLLCLLGKFDEAARRVNDTEQRSAICHFARLLMKKFPTVQDETQKKNMKRQIVDLFIRAQQHGPAFEFAFNNQMVDDVVALSISAPKPVIARAAKFYEEKNDLRVAALLWNRAGRMNKALALCLERDAQDALEEIADSVKQGTDPAVLEKCAELFMENGQYKRAANFFALAHKIDRAKEICEEKNIKLPQEFLENMASLKSDPETTKQIAELCEQQEAYITAAQIYIKLNDHLSAMRNIIAAGDTEKVVKFATILKRKDAFVCAADYIAGTQPKAGSQLFQTCVQFYQRGGAFDKIADFLDKTAQVEIEDEQNYELAAELLKKAHQTMAKTEMTKERDTQVESYLQKIRWIEMYLEATRCVRSDPIRMQGLCNELLQTKGVEECLRIEDVYMLLVQYFVGQENYVQAHRILENMRMNGVDLKYFMEEESISRIYRAAGQVYTPADGSDSGADDDIPDDVVEAVSDDF